VLLWTAFNSFGTQWGRGKAAMQRSDMAIRKLAGIDPRHFQPRIYRAVTEATSRQYDYYSRMHMPLSDEEVTMLKLVFFSALARRAQDQEKRQKLGGAISKLKRIARERIRHEILVEVTARTGY
jgi:hypothetical protein